MEPWRTWTPLKLFLPLFAMVVLAVHQPAAQHTSLRHPSASVLVSDEEQRAITSKCKEACPAKAVSSCMTDCKVAISQCIISHRYVDAGQEPDEDAKEDLEKCKSKAFETYKNYSDNWDTERRFYDNYR